MLQASAGIRRKTAQSEGGNKNKQESKKRGQYVGSTTDTLFSGYFCCDFGRSGMSASDAAYGMCVWQEMSGRDLSYHQWFKLISALLRLRLP